MTSVIGGGVIGVSAAFRLAQAGAHVTLLEARELASGTSGSSFAWMNANNKAPLEYHRLNVGGMAEHSTLREEFGQAPWLHDDGNVIWEGATGDNSETEPAVPVKGEALEPRVRRLREWGYPVELLSPAELTAIHPDINLPTAIERLAYFPTEGYIDVRLLVATLAHAARSNGADIRTGQEVVEITQASGRVTGVRTADGDQFSANVVVSCTGRWTDQVTALAGASVPMAPTLGLLVVSSPTVTTLRCIVHTPGVNLRPDGGSRILMASYDTDLLLKPDMPQETLRHHAEHILERSADVLPALKGSTVEAYRVGVRAIPQDSFPVIGPIDGLDGFYTIGTHSGVTMGPFLGRLATREILDGKLDDRLAAFRPDRLFATAQG